MYVGTPSWPPQAVLHLAGWSSFVCNILDQFGKSWQRFLTSIPQGHGHKCECGKQHSPRLKLGASRLTPSYVRGVRPNYCAKGADRVTFHPEHRPKFHAIAFKLDGHAHLGARIASGDVPSTPARSARRRRRANGGNECFGFSAQLKALAPGMEGFGRHAHDRLPLNRTESR